VEQAGAASGGRGAVRRAEFREGESRDGEREEGRVTNGSATDGPRVPGSRRVVLLVSRDEFGQGPSDLGGVLMRSFLKILGGSDTRPERAIFVNSGVRLTTAGSEVLEDVKALESAGVEVLSCGTCLEYFGLKDQLEVGRPTNMKDTVAALMAADHIVCP
jgi:selenium metabolism protein YedF